MVLLLGQRKTSCNEVTLSALHEVMKMFILSGFSLLLVLFFSRAKPSSPSSISDQRLCCTGWISTKKGSSGWPMRTELFQGQRRSFQARPSKPSSKARRSRYPVGKMENAYGETIEYFYNGRKRRVIRFAEGVREGEAEEYRITGELLGSKLLRQYFERPEKEWHPNGAKAFLGRHEGWETPWRGLGMVSRRIQKVIHLYRHGLREGLPPNGILRVSKEHVNFLPKGQEAWLETTWYENGQKRIVADFIDDMMEGNSKGWFSNGQLAFDFNFEKIKSTEFAPNGTRTAKRSRASICQRYTRARSHHGFESRGSAAPPTPIEIPEPPYPPATWPLVQPHRLRMRKAPATEPTSSVAPPPPPSAPEPAPLPAVPASPTDPAPKPLPSAASSRAYLRSV